MKKICAYTLSVIMLLTSLLSFNTAFGAASTIRSTYDLTNAFANGGSYTLAADVNVPSTEITRDIEISGSGYKLRNAAHDAPATLYQNSYVASKFTGVAISGGSKQDVGIWLGAGSMTFTDCTMTSYRISSGRYAALAAAGSSTVTLNNTSFTGNKEYDLYLTDNVSLNLNGTSSVDKVYAETNFVKFNLGADWSGNMELTYKAPVSRCIGKVSENADISGITVTNDGFHLEDRDGRLILVNENEAAVHFDMSGRDTLYKGSTGFLYGAAEINVPSIDLLTGLRPDTMVQKAYDGLQHPTGDAVRTGSALLASGVRDMQIYLQDHYLEWPYDAPYKNGEIDLDTYQKTVETILYGMICDEVKNTDDGAFRGSDGKYYTLNDNAKNYSYVLFNEPDQIWYGGNLDGLKKAWKKLYFAVHAIDPDARCVGPNYSGFNAEQYDSFLSYCYENGCLPEIISWHELGDISMTDYYAHYDAVKSMQAKYYTGDFQPQLMVNEYARHYDIGAPGGLVKWLSMFEDKDMSGCMAYWAMANTLNEMAADQNSPTSTWWVYHWYAQMTGAQCPITSPDFDKSRFWGVTSYDDGINMAYALFGGSENQHDTENVYLDNINMTDLQNAQGAVNVKLYAVSFSGQLGANYKPQLIFDGAVAADENTVKISVADTDEMDAFFAVITKPEDGAALSDMTDVTVPTLSYEAEEAELLGGASAYDKYGWTSFATSGRGEVGSINNNGDGVRFTVNVPENGYYTASLFYSLQAPFVNPLTLVPDANGQNRGIGKALPYGVALDGKALDNIVLESTVTWSYKNHNDMRVYLTAGEHTLTYTHINGNEGSKGNLQLVAAIDKLDLNKSDDNDSDFEMNLSEMKSFKTENGYKVTAIAPEAGYYALSADGNLAVSKQCVDYASDAKSTSECGVYYVKTGNTLYLSKGANTLLINTDADSLYFNYSGTKTQSITTEIKSSQFTLHGNSPYLKSSKYAHSGYTVAELGVGQSPKSGDKGAYNYLTFKVNAATDGVYNLAIRYTNDEPAPVMQKADGSTYIHPYNIDLVERYAQISVNGGEPETVYFKNTLSLDTFRTVDVQVQLTAGENTVKIYNDNSYQFSTLVNSTAPEIDTVSISKLDYDGSSAAYVKGAASTRHSYKSTSALTKATPSAAGKNVSTHVCTVCGYKYTETKAIAKISKVTLSKTEYTYTGKEIKPTVKVTDSSGKTIASSNYTVSYSNNKKVGQASVKVTFKGNYSGIKTATFKINPKGTSLTKVTAQKKGFKAAWSKKSVTGYQIQYSTSKNFNGAKTKTVNKAKTASLTVKGLKSKKKYYVRIRTYQTVGGKKYYSPYSKAKTVKTK